MSAKPENLPILKINVHEKADEADSNSGAPQSVLHEGLIFVSHENNLQKSDASKELAKTGISAGTS